MKHIDALLSRLLTDENPAELKLDYATSSLTGAAVYAVELLTPNGIEVIGEGPTFIAAMTALDEECEIFLIDYIDGMEQM